MSAHRIVLISPDKDTDYCYLDMPKEEALKRFKEHEDWVNIYEPRGGEPRVSELEFDECFLLWRDQSNDLARIMEDHGIPSDITDLFKRRPDDQ